MTPLQLSTESGVKLDTIRKRHNRTFPDVPFSANMQLNEPMLSFYLSVYGRTSKTDKPDKIVRVSAKSNVLSMSATIKDTQPQPNTDNGSTIQPDRETQPDTDNGPTTQPDKETLFGVSKSQKTAWQQYLPVLANLQEMVLVLHTSFLLGGVLFLYLGVIYCLVLGYIQYTVTNANNVRSGENGLTLAFLMNVAAAWLLEYPGLKIALEEQGQSLPYAGTWYPATFAAFVSLLSFAAVWMRWSKAKDDFDFETYK